MSAGHKVVCARVTVTSPLLFDSSIYFHVSADMILDEEKLDKLIHDCQESGNWSSLKQSLWDVFSSPECLGHSWPSVPSSDASEAASVMTSNTCDTQNFKKMTKEEVRALEGEKDVDSCEADE